MKGGGVLTETLKKIPRLLLYYACRLVKSYPRFENG
jgi:hypothetical protein